MSGAQVLLVDDHELLAQSLAMALGGEGHEVKVVPVGPGETILDFARQNRPKVVLLDLDLGRAGTSIPLIPRLVDQGATVIMLTGESDRVLLAACVEAGASAVASKASSFEVIVELVQSAVVGEELMKAGERDDWLGELRQARVAEQERTAPLRSLSQREAQVLALMMEGLPAEQIAARSFTALSTVRTQIRAVLQKLGVTSQLQAVTLAQRAGWVPNPPVAPDGED